MSDLADRIARALDGIQPPMIDEPNAYKRAVAREAVKMAEEECLAAWNTRPGAVKAPHLERLLALVEAETGVFENCSNEPDDEPVGVDGDGRALEMTFGDVRRARADLSCLTSPADVRAEAYSAGFNDACEAADSLGYHCVSCGHLCGHPAKDLEIIRKAGGRSCCPERELEPLSAAIRALGGQEE